MPLPNPGRVLRRKDEDLRGFFDDLDNLRRKAKGSAAAQAHWLRARAPRL